ncbi:MAG: MerR family transcriptional regulator [Oscillospiraceae bacterium]|nr:MerR family transcriptional regulator [Oscillospiraceae bacterium]
MKTVKEISRITGVSVRTLHYYDEIGLLKPTETTAAGYRLYDDTALRRLQNILLFRELQFPLKEIRIILDSSDFDPQEALTRQIELLELQKKHIENLISFARDIQTKGVNTMNFDAFDKSEIEKYKAEAKERWGNTPAYKEYEAKAASDSYDESQAARGLMDIIARAGALRDLSPDDAEVQSRIADLQQFITDNYYLCTKEILRGLGEMYVSDERFRENIDRAGGAGTAEFIRRAIQVYCGE